MSKVKVFLFLHFIFFFPLPALAQVDTAWVRRYNGPGNGQDEAVALAVDDSGNVYVTGSGGNYFDLDYVTIKYAPNGDTLWIRRYNGSGFSEDQARALAVDDSGNVYVTGFSGINPNYDYATIKYAPSGDTLWVRRYNGPGNSSDYATALEVDNIGFVYVTGFSDPDSTPYNYNHDYATIKYGPYGHTIWVRRYNGLENGEEAASALAVDDSGNVYVTGRSDGKGTGWDYAIIKYAPDGDTLWVRRYNGPGNSYDRANALTVDDSGNVYITGYSFGSGTYSDYATIKYAPNGDTLWVRRYNGPVSQYDVALALAVDGSGNVYVTGYEEGIYPVDYDYATIKYASNGDTTWVRRHNGPGNSDDRARALAVDGSGNVYVTGSGGSYPVNDFVTIKYAPDGDTLWVRRYNRPGNSDDQALALAVDDNGNVCVTGRSRGLWTPYDYATIKYASNGDTTWVRRHNEPAKVSNYATDLAVDGGGNVYVTGNPATLKFLPNGDTAWVRGFSGTALTVDKSGNVYVTGEGGTIKYSANGDSLRFGFDAYSGVDIATDDSGNVFVIGYVYRDGIESYVTIKYAPNADTLWVRGYIGPGNYWDHATDLAVDNSGHVYVTGYSVFDYGTIKYAHNGDSLWVRRYGGLGYGHDKANALAVDESGNVYVTGVVAVVCYDFPYLCHGGDYATIKYTPNGDTLWVRRYNVPGNSGEVATALAVDDSGNVYVTGVIDIVCEYFPYSCYGGDYVTIKYTPNGDTSWVRRYNGPTDTIDVANALAVDNGGNVYVTGESGTIKYSANGESLWFGVYGGVDIAVDDFGNIYVTGSSGGDYVTVKYVQYTCLAKPGDVTGDSAITLPDIIAIIDFVFRSQPAPNPLCRGDANGNGNVLLTDIVYLINFIFKSGPAPVKSKECCL
ncbi:MAG: hypothetical protein RBG1_1C00001G0217 [candidate division Zixibacteria bacterium RBG-1]|nr:MAG: hypothetical protein RBG1_1C00001G0217 [candidate division Zixibacteria bacterium RBG-1]OGC83926.1 MAG: hypothetical protein A2V73_03695 [candidate division Zixibacteria bacterium RBG_19FT_COMBO_42_43]